ncbi:DUF1801 domain-containing protein [Mycolicibacterium thermoresistibile]
MTRTSGDTAVTDKIAELPAFRDVAARLHEIIMAAAPDLTPRLWYGMPGYAKSKSSPVLCFFRVDADDYVSFGLTEKANLAPDEDADHKLIGGAWYLTEIDDPTATRLATIVKRAVC